MAVPGHNWAWHNAWFVNMLGSCLRCALSLDMPIPVWEQPQRQQQMLWDSCMQTKGTKLQDAANGLSIYWVSLAGVMRSWQSAIVGGVPIPSLPNTLAAWAGWPGIGYMVAVPQTASSEELTGHGEAGSDKLDFLAAMTTWACCMIHWEEGILLTSSFVPNGVVWKWRI